MKEPKGRRGDAETGRKKVLVPNIPVSPRLRVAASPCLRVGSSSFRLHPSSLFLRRDSIHQLRVFAPSLSTRISRPR